MNLINRGDFSDILTKISQRGIPYFLSKLNIQSKKRTLSTFNVPDLAGSNWWMIPEVKLRENRKISGNEQTTFDAYLAENYFREDRQYRLLSVGCGLGNREIRMAGNNPSVDIRGVDLAGNLIGKANKRVQEKGLTNIRFEQADFYTYPLEKDSFDAVLFHSGLHHFRNMEQIVVKVREALRPDGILILNEYAGKNRLQFSKPQLAEMNRLLRIIPPEYRTRFLTNRLKKKIYAPGLLRMIVSDPSEAVESEQIREAVHRHFNVLEEKHTGGDLLMMVLKDIAHHFTNPDDAKSKQILDKLFQEEDNYLEKIENPDFIFGIYRKIQE